MAEKEYLNIARDVIDAVGGQDNISSMAHCATRLRLVVKDRDKIQDSCVSFNFLSLIRNH